MALINNPPRLWGPRDILTGTPCLECLSVTQLHMIEMYLWGIKAGYTFPDGLSTLLEDSTCWQCVSETRQLVGRITKLADEMAELLPASLDDIVDDIKCFPCLSLGQIRAAFTYAFIKSFDTVL